MSSKEEIKVAFTNELKNTPEYADVIGIKQIILNEIATPNILENIKYNFSTPKSEEQQSILNLCLLVEFGFTTQSMTSTFVVLEMKHFLT